jgi:hypothetical protein
MTFKQSQTIQQIPKFKCSLFVVVPTILVKTLRKNKDWEETFEDKGKPPTSQYLVNYKWVGIIHK